MPSIGQVKREELFLGKVRLPTYINFFKGDQKYVYQVILFVVASKTQQIEQELNGRFGEIDTEKKNVAHFVIKNFGLCERSFLFSRTDLKA